MSNYVSKEIVLNNLELPPEVEILYTSWTVNLVSTGEEVYYIEEDYENLTSKVFNNVFEIGKKYSVTMNMVRTDGPTVHTKPLEVLIEANEDIYTIYPMPSVVDTPLVSVNHSLDGIPTNMIEFIGSDISVLGNATIDYSDWYLTNDNNDIIWSSLRDQYNRQSIVVSNVDLNPNTVYTMHLVYTGTNNDKSGMGSITFKPANLSMLDIVGDLNSVYYGYDIHARIKATNMSLFEYELVDTTGTVVYATTNTTGLILISSGLVNKNHNEYKLRVRVTINNVVYGWRVYSIKPKVFEVLSTDIRDTTYEYFGTTLETDLLISYQGNGFATSSLPYGRSYQLPTGDILMLSSSNSIGRYMYNAADGVLRYLGDVDIDGMIIDGQSNDSIIQLFDNGILLVAQSNGRISLAKYDPMHYRYTAITSPVITVTTQSLSYTEFYLHNDVILFMTNDTNCKLYSINSTGVLSLLLDNVTPGHINGGLIKLGNDRFIIRYGFNTSTNVLSSTAKLIKFTGNMIESITTFNLPLNSSNTTSTGYTTTILKNGNILVGVDNITPPSNTGRGVKFNGSNQYIKCCEITDIENFSFCISYKHTIAIDKIISGVIDTINQERDYIGINVAGKLGIGLGGTTYNASGRFITRDLVAGRVYNLCLTKEGDVFNFYVDGVLELSGVETDWVVPSGFVALGAIYNASTQTVTNHYNTVLANAFFTREVLSLQQVQFMHNTPHRFIYKNNVGLVTSDAGIDLTLVQTYMPLSELDEYVRDIVSLDNNKYPIVNYTSDCRSLATGLSNTLQIVNYKRDSIGVYKSVSDGYEFDIPNTDSASLVFLETSKPLSNSKGHTIRLNNGNVILLQPITSTKAKTIIYK